MKSRSSPTALFKNRFVLVLLASSAFLFQNCGEFTAISTPLSSIAGSADTWRTAGGGTLRPATDKSDPSCSSNSKYDACVFFKNPVAAQNASFSGSVGSSSSLDGVQIYGVKLVGLTGSSLANSTISVDSVQGSPVVVGSTNLKQLARTDTKRSIAQVMAYYWINRTQDYLSERTGSSPARGKSIRVVADDTLAGWSPDTNSIHLRISDAGEVMAWNADIAIHFFGQANLHHASAGAIRQNPATRHKTCGLKTFGCCSDSYGCSRAIASGVGDYFAAMIFPDQPTVGESWANRTQGLGFCNLSRDLNEARTRTARAAYDACSASGVAGETSTMGTVYASIWWQVRKNAEAMAPAIGAIDIDTLFMKHLTVLNGEDNFSTAIVKIMQLDQTLNRGKYSALFQSELVARGL
jgi:hypothetical protein